MATTRFIDHLLEGDHASRPAAGDVPEGTLYSCTTHGLIYQSDTSTWTTWATLGGVTDLDTVLANSSGQDIADALTGAAAPDAGNVFATMADVTGGTSGVTLLEQHSASSSASLDFTTAISSTYDEYLIELLNIIPATNAVTFKMLMSTNGGSSYDTSSIYSWTNMLYASGIVGQISTSQSQINLHNSGDAVSNNSNWGYIGQIRLFSPGSTALYKRILGHGMYFSSASAREGIVFSAAYESTTAVDAFQFLMSSGNIASGIIRVYGVAK